MSGKKLPPVYLINGDYKRPDDDWCEVCAKPSMLIAPLYILSDHGVTFWGWFAGCKEEKRWQKIKKPFDAEDYEKVTKFMSNRVKIRPPKKPQLAFDELPAPDEMVKVETIYIEGKIHSDNLPKAKCTCGWETEENDNLLKLGLAAKQHALDTGHQLRQHDQENW